MNPGGGSGWDEPPLDIQIPDDARELDRDVLAYHRELRAKRRRNRLRRLTGPFAAHGTVMPVLASILAVCLVAGAMLSVATFSPATAPAGQADPAGHGVPHRPARAAAVERPGLRPAESRPATTGTSPAPGSREPGPAPRAPGPAPRAPGPAPRHRDQPREHRDQPRERQDQPRERQPGQRPGLVHPAEPVRLRPTWSPALTAGGATATIFFRPTDSESRRPLR